MSIVGIGQIPVQKSTTNSLRQLGFDAARHALDDAGIAKVDALYVSNMLSDELQFQKHLGSLFADELGVSGVEALQIRAATASGAAALRVGFMSIASRFAETALVLGVEKMSQGSATPALSKALDAEKEVPDGATLISQNARLMRQYFETYHPPEDALAHFPVLAHNNARNNPNALFRDRQFRTEDVLKSRLISPPIRLLDCSPICDGAAAVILAPTDDAHKYTNKPVRLLASAIATDRYRISDRIDPLALKAAQLSARKAFAQTSSSLTDMDLFELHDAFSIMTCLALEALGFAEPGSGWRLGAKGRTAIDGDIPICTMGGLKARGHPIGASAIYQTCEITLQLTGRAGANQVPGATQALMQSVGGAASTVITHIFSC